MKKEKSPFFEEITQAFEKAMEKRTDDDCALVLVADSNTSANIIGGKASTLLQLLLGAMRKNHWIANIVCSAALEWHIQAMQQTVLKVPPVPEDGLAEWPQKAVFIGMDKGSDSKGS